MLTRLAVTNFKRFRALDLPMRPLTVLTGLNGAGKTSAIQALLLARLASRSRHVELNGPYGLALGDASDVLHFEANEGEDICVTASRGDDSSTWRLRAPQERSLHLDVHDPPAEPVAPFAGSEQGFLYLCAERWGPRDVLGMSSAQIGDLHPGHQGEFVAQVLATLDRVVVRDALLHPRARTGEAPITTLKDNVEWWLSEIVCPVRLDVTTVSQANVAVLRFGVSGQPTARTRPPNGGFGVTYALPIFVAALMAPRGGLLIIENPEAHLHPAGQSAMGRFLARVAGDGVQVIVETHSDHVLNGLRRAIASDDVLSAEDAVVHFFAVDEAGAPAVTSITPRPNGELPRWPRGFFDQMDHDLAALARARRRGR